ncbi:MAG: M28 family peptidase, partial [Promethearchaeota archaeon]
MNFRFQVGRYCNILHVPELIKSYQRSELIMKLLRFFLTFSILFIIFLTITKTTTNSPISVGSTLEEDYNWINQVDGNRMLTDIQVLASNQFGGRYPATEGDELTLNYLNYQLTGLNASPLTNRGDFRQPFNVTPWVMPIAPIDLTIAGETLVYGKDYVELAYTGNSSVVTPTEIVFAGYGIFSSTFNDYRDLDVSGKIVLVCRRTPPGGEVDPYHGYFSVKAYAAYLRGAMCMIVVEPPWSGTDKAVKGTLTSDGFIPDMGSLSANRTSLEQLGLNISDWINEVDTAYNSTGSYFGSHSRYTGINATLEVRSAYRANAESANIIAKFQGTETGSSERAFIISAHHDHLGASPVGSIFYGADDDASGVAVVLEVARVLNGLYKNNNFRKTVIIAFWGGEEEGLIGSRHFTYTEPLFPLQQIDLVIQHDMVGVGPVDGKLRVGEGYHFPAVVEDIDQVALEYGNIQEVIVSEDASDHLAFLEKNVPAVNFFWDDLENHPYLHTTQDTADLITPEILEKVTLTTLGYLIDSQNLLITDSSTMPSDSSTMPSDSSTVTS